MEQGWESSPHPGNELAQLRTLCWPLLHLFILLSPCFPSRAFPLPCVCSGDPQFSPTPRAAHKAKGKGDISRGFPFSLLKTPVPQLQQKSSLRAEGVSAAPELRGAFPAHREHGEGCLGL